MRTESIKLNHFKTDIMTEVAEKKRNIDEKAEKQFESEYEAKELQFLEEAYDIIQSGLKQIDQEKIEVISKTEMENKVKLLYKRKEIIDRVFEKAKEKIEEYTKTEEYKTELLEKIKANMEYVGEGNYTIYINYKDKHLYNLVQDTFKEANVIIERKYIDMIGGCKLLNNTSKIYVDDSISKRLEKEEEDFLQYCKIEIEEEVGD